MYMYIKPFYCTKFFIAAVKSFRLVRDMQECTAEFSKKIFLETFLFVVHFSYTNLFHRKKTKKKHQKFKENMWLKTYYCHLKL